MIADPEGHLLQLAGDGEEYQTEVLDLDAVTKIREHGTVGLNRMWAQLEKEGGALSLPLYERSLAPAADDGRPKT